MTVERIYYTKGDDVNNDEDLQNLLNKGWKVKSITPQHVAVHMIARQYNNHNEHKTAKGGFLIVLVLSS